MSKNDGHDAASDSKGSHHSSRRVYKAAATVKHRSTKHHKLFGTDQADQPHGSTTIETTRSRSSRSSGGQRRRRLGMEMPPDDETVDADRQEAVVTERGRVVSPMVRQECLAVDQTTSPVPSIITPSTGMTSPERTSTKSPNSSASTGIRSSF